MIERPGKKDSFPQIWALGACVLVFAVLYLVMGYAAGYGKVVDGEVEFRRQALWQDMRMDYVRDEGEWGFGMFVPLAVAGLFWFRRREILASPVDPALKSGGLILLFGFLIYWAGYRGEQKYFGYAAGQILVLGTLLWFLGWGWFGKVFWLWALLGMMWPWRLVAVPDRADLGAAAVGDGEVDLGVSAIVRSGGGEEWKRSAHRHGGPGGRGIHQHGY